MKLTLTINAAQMQYLQAYGEIFGYDAEWAAMQCITDGICERIDAGMLEKKARTAFEGAKEIGRKGRAP